jgi:hypothetical protein
MSFTSSLLVAQLDVSVEDSVARRARKCKSEAHAEPKSQANERCVRDVGASGPLGTRAWAELRFDEIETPFDPIEAVVHSIEARAHLRHFPRQVRDAALDGTEATALFALLLADFPKLVPDRSKMFEKPSLAILQPWRYRGLAPASTQDAAGDD